MDAQLKTLSQPPKAGGDSDFNRPNDMRQFIAKRFEVVYKPRALPKSNIDCIKEVKEIAVEGMKKCEIEKAINTIKGLDTKIIESRQKSMRGALNICDQLKTL